MVHGRCDECLVSPIVVEPLKLLGIGKFAPVKTRHLLEALKTFQTENILTIYNMDGFTDGVTFALW